jgi:hypothetical protein
MSETRQPWCAGLLAVLVTLAGCGSDPPRSEAVADAAVCPRQAPCAACLAGQPTGTLCRTRWEECQTDAACVAALPALYSCLCGAASRDERFVCAGDFSTASDKAFNLAYCVGVDACGAQCLE